ncbi:MAG: O-antigen ligase family protein [Saprospiraceae bacterium]|nr:O-antigen ligase family protein [Saprospiraceae bacterium]
MVYFSAVISNGKLTAALWPARLVRVLRLDGMSPVARMLFWIFGLIVFGSCIAAVALDDLRLLVAPVLAFGLFLAVADVKRLYLLLWATIPISTEVSLPNGVGTDLPDEPLMILLFGIGMIMIVSRLHKFSFRLLLHPITLFLLLHLAWIGLTTIHSDDLLVSLKFFLAKSWYIVVFYVMGYLLIRGERDWRQWFYWVIIPLLLTVVVVVVRHALAGFTFDSINSVLNPFYRNHVSYALMLGVITPFIWFFRHRIPGRYGGILLTLFVIIAIYFAYTRAAYLGLLTAVAGYWIMRLRLTRVVLVVTIAGALITYTQLAKDNRYMDYAPDYYRTITHYEFDNLIEATYKLEDISTMERFYRWIAGFYMIADQPLLGFGPGNFYGFYKSYTDENFVTYVSHNPERSGIHNYFLMTAVEQGLPGLVIFILLIAVVLLKAEWMYRKLPEGLPRHFLSACVAALYFILFVLLLNDMIETDKIGSVFFFCLAMIAALELRHLPTARTNTKLSDSSPDAISAP